MAELTETQVLDIENMGAMELQKTHLYYIRACMEYDLWKDISDKHCYKMREALGRELRIRMNAI